MIKEKDSILRLFAAYSLGAAFPSIPNKEQAWIELHMLSMDKVRHVRRGAAKAIGDAFPHIPKKEQGFEDLIHMSQDNYSDVRISANYSIGRASIFRAIEAKNKDYFRKELENAIESFEKSSKEALPYSNPSRFCLPFYNSFYTLTFKKQKTEAELQKYLSEARNAVEGSESKEKLLEAVENLGNALKEVQNLRGMDFESMKCDLNAYRRYCERAAELLDTTEEKAPFATRLIKKGLPIIDDNIKGILAEIQENATALCRQTKGTTFQDLGREIEQIGKTFPEIKDPIRLEKSTGNMMIVLSQICAKLPEGERGDACELLKKAKEEPYVEDRLDLINMFLSKIPPQIGGMNKTIIVNQYGNGDRFYNESIDNSINISGDLATDLETLSALIKRDYSQDDMDEILQTVKQMKQSCNDPSKKNWLKEKLGLLVTRTSEVASISSFVMTILDKLK